MTECNLLNLRMQNCSDNLGCTFSSYNTGMYSLNSIFSGLNCGMNYSGYNTYNGYSYSSCSPFINCNGTFNWNKFALYNVLSQVGTFAASALTNFFVQKKVEKAEEVSASDDIKADIKSFNDDISKNLSELDLSSEEELKSYTATPDTSFDNAINAAQTKYDEMNAILSMLKKPGDKEENESDAEYNKRVCDYATQYAQAEKNVKDAKAKLEAAQNAKAAEKKRLKDIVTRTNQLISARNIAQQQLNDIIAQRAEGRRSSIKEGFKPESVEHNNFKRRDIEQLVLGFNTSEDGSAEKLKYAKALQGLNNILFKRMSTSEQQAVRGWADEYVKKHS